MVKVHYFTVQFAVIYSIASDKNLAKQFINLFRMCKFDFCLKQ